MRQQSDREWTSEGKPSREVRGDGRRSLYRKCIIVHEESAEMRIWVAPQVLSCPI